MRVKLTPANVSKLQPAAGLDRQIIYDDSDSAPPAFGIRVTPNSRTFVVAYRTRRGQKRLERLAKVGAITLAAARKAARAVLAKVAEGRDPVEEGRKNETDSVEAVVRDYIAVAKTRRGAPRSAKTQGDYGRMLRGAIEGKAFGRRSVHEVKAWDIEQFLNGVRKEVYRDRLHALLRASFRWALRKGRVKTDPTTALDRVIRIRLRKRVLTDEEIRAVWLAEIEPARARAAVRLMLLLLTREGETLRMRWSDVDTAKATWTIQGEDRKGGRAFVVPLAPQALVIIESLRGESPFVFAGPNGGISLLSNPQRLIKELRKKSGVADMVLHDLRRTAASGIAELGYPDELIERLLGHKQRSGSSPVTQRHYQLFDRLPERRTALEAWARHVEALASDEVAANNVVPMVRS